MICFGNCYRVYCERGNFLKSRKSTQSGLTVDATLEELEGKVYVLENYENLPI